MKKKNKKEEAKEIGGCGEKRMDGSSKKRQFTDFI